MLLEGREPIRVHYVVVVAHCLNFLDRGKFHRDFLNESFVMILLSIIVTFSWKIGQC